MILNFNIFFIIIIITTNLQTKPHNNGRGRSCQQMNCTDVLKKDKKKIAKKSEQSEANKDKNIIIIEMQKKVYV